MLKWLAENWMWLVGLWLAWRVTHLLGEVRQRLDGLREDTMALGAILDLAGWLHPRWVRERMEAEAFVRAAQPTTATPPPSVPATKSGEQEG